MGDIHYPFDCVIKMMKCTTAQEETKMPKAVVAASMVFTGAATDVDTQTVEGTAFDTTVESSEFVEETNEEETTDSSSYMTMAQKYWYLLTLPFVVGGLYQQRDNVAKAKDATVKAVKGVLNKEEENKQLMNPTW